MIGIGLIKGLSVTFLNMARATSTVQYPDRRLGLMGAAKSEGVSLLKLLISRPGTVFRALTGRYVVPETAQQAPRFRGNEFSWYEDRCTGCASCAKYCPMGIIEIITEPGGFDSQEGESYAIQVFDIDTGRCMFCGLCVEACPYDALHMGTRFERAHQVRRDLVISKDELNENAKHPSSWFRPQIEERNLDPYGKPSGDHHTVGRHEKPTDDDLKLNWVDKR